MPKELARPITGTILLTELAANILPGHPIAVFSGPSFADEVFDGLPAALVTASHSPATAIQIQDAFEGSNLRLYTIMIRLAFHLQVQ